MEDLENKLFEAAAEGSKTSLQKLLRQDPLILERDATNRLSETPLHVAAMLGHTDFVREVVKIKPQLVTELNSLQSSPLHLASAKGHVDVVKALLSADPRPCLARDRNGMTPLHVAAVKGRIEVMKVLMSEAPDEAQLMANRGESILHMCVKHHQLEALKLLLNKLRDRDCVNMKDADGNALLHLAVAYKQVETIEFLLSMPGLDVNAQNLNGMTAADILIHGRRDMRDVEIQEFLKRAGACGSWKHMDHDMAVDMLNLTKREMRGEEIQESLKHTGACRDQNVENRAESRPSAIYQGWLEQKRGALMIVASLLATVAFQAGVNPPGGVWQENKPDNSTETKVHRAGESIMGQNHLSYTTFYATNTASLVSSLSIILLLVSGLPLRRRLFVWILMVITWIAITATTLAYCFAIGFLTNDQNDPVINILVGTVFGWLALMAAILVSHTIRMIVRLVKALKRMIVKVVKKQRRRPEITIPTV